MKRLFPVLILAAFLLGIVGARVAHTHVNFQLCASSQSYPQFSVYLPGVELSNTWEAVQNLPPPPGNYIFPSKPPWETLPPSDGPGPSSQKTYGCLGLGCGGLPS